MSRLRVAIVAPSLAILGGQSVQAQQLIQAWSNDPEVEAWLVPVNPAPPGALLTALARKKYIRTVITQASYWPLLWHELRRADVVHVFSASYSSYLLSTTPAMFVAARLGRPVSVELSQRRGAGSPTPLAVCPPHAGQRRPGGRAVTVPC